MSMLSVAFKLTPAQTKLLLAIVYHNYVKVMDDLLTLQPRREGIPDNFIVTIRCLIARGLVTHDEDGWPTWNPTDEGRAIASLIVKECRAVVEMVDDMPKRLKRLAPVIEAEKQSVVAREAYRRRHAAK